MADERALLEAGRAALEDRLGVHGALRFLRLLGGGKDRFEDHRASWVGASMDDLVAEMQREGLMTRGEGSPRPRPRSSSRTGVASR